MFRSTLVLKFWLLMLLLVAGSGPARCRSVGPRLGVRCLTCGRFASPRPRARTLTSRRNHMFRSTLVLKFWLLMLLVAAGRRLPRRRSVGPLPSRLDSGRGHLSPPAVPSRS